MLWQNFFTAILTRVCLHLKALLRAHREEMHIYMYSGCLAVAQSKFLFFFWLNCAAVLQGKAPGGQQREVLLNLAVTASPEEVPLPFIHIHQTPRGNEWGMKYKTAKLAATE